MPPSVSTVLVQRNINAILQGARSSHPPLQDAALDVLTFTVKQGLHHPLQVRHCLPHTTKSGDSLPNVVNADLDRARNK